MDNLFKQKLLSLRHPPVSTTFSQAVMGGEVSWGQPVAVKTAPQVVKAASPQEDAPALSIPLVEAEAVPRIDTNWSGVAVAGGLEQLRKELSLGPELLDIILQDKRPAAVSVLFVSEVFREWDEVKKELQGSFIDELLCGFGLKTAELFERMIVAMKLERSEVCIYPVESVSADLSHEVMALAAYLKPQVIVTLGARATQQILKTQDRLTMVHGQFFKREIAGLEPFAIVPLFHPSIIETNQNMKKTAWTDMQKIMRHLKKLQ